MKTLSFPLKSHSAVGSIYCSLEMKASVTHENCFVGTTEVSQEYNIPQNRWGDSEDDRMLPCEDDKDCKVILLSAG